MKEVIKWLDENLEMSICIVLMSLMTVIIFIQVIMRYVFSNSLSWSEELARYLFIWLIYFGISYGAKIRKHIKIEAFLNLIPKSIRKYVPLVGDILFLGFSIFVVFTGYDLVQKQMRLGQTSPALQVPMAVIYLAPLVGFFLTSIRQVQAIIFRIKVLQGKAVDE